MSIQAHAMDDVLAILEKRVGLGLNGRRIDAVAATALVAMATDALVLSPIASMHPDSPNQPRYTRSWVLNRLAQSAVPGRLAFQS